MAEIKTKKRNLLSDEILPSRIYQSKDAEKIALRWLKTKSSRNFGLVTHSEEPELHDSYDLFDIYLEKIFL